MRAMTPAVVALMFVCLLGLGGPSRGSDPAVIGEVLPPRM